MTGSLLISSWMPNAIHCTSITLFTITGCCIFLLSILYLLRDFGLQSMFFSNSHFRNHSLNFQRPGISFPETAFCWWSRGKCVCKLWSQSAWNFVGRTGPQASCTCCQAWAHDDVEGSVHLEGTVVNCRWKMLLFEGVTQISLPSCSAVRGLGNNRWFSTHSSHLLLKPWSMASTPKVALTCSPSFHLPFLVVD